MPFVHVLRIEHTGSPTAPTPLWVALVRLQHTGLLVRLRIRQEYELVRYQGRDMVWQRLQADGTPTRAYAGNHVARALRQAWAHRIRTSGRWLRGQDEDT